MPDQGSDAEVMDRATETAVDEIRQLIAQFRKEVPRSRGAWPESIKTRAARLAESGRSAKQISEWVGLSYFTVLGWIPRELRRRYRKAGSGSQTGYFAAVAIRPSRECRALNVTKQVPQARETSTVTVTLPGGAVIDGVTPEFLRAWLGADSGA